MNGRERIGFMQGRLSPLVDGRIQAFPWPSWREEFAAADRLGLGLMEWTLDQDRLYENPLMTSDGQNEIRTLSARHHVRIPSLTGDCFMQAPFWKARGVEHASLVADFSAIAAACAALDIAIVVVPLVDNGRLENEQQAAQLCDVMRDQQSLLDRLGVKIAFESDAAPADLRRFADELDPATFGINYDIGNSASLGFDAAEELSTYGDRVLNVHVKDRLRGGTTVPLGSGAAAFDAAFAALHRAGYEGNFILQTARAADGDHARVLGHYRDLTAGWVERSVAA